MSEQAHEMISEKRIPMNEAEHAALDKLLEEHGDDLAGATRRDAGDTGPLLIFLHDNTTWEISEDGKRKKVS